MKTQILTLALLMALSSCATNDNSDGSFDGSTNARLDGSTDGSLETVSMGGYELAFIKEGNTPPYLNQSEIWVIQLGGEPKRAYYTEYGRRIGSLAKLPGEDALLAWIYRFLTDGEGDIGRLYRLDYDGTLTALSEEHKGSYATIDATDADHIAVTGSYDSFALIKGVEHKIAVSGNNDLFFDQAKKYIYSMRGGGNDNHGIVRFAVDALPAGDWENWELVQQVDVATMEGEILGDIHLCREGGLIAFFVKRTVNVDTPHTDVYLKKPGQPAERLGGKSGVDDRFPILSPDCSKVVWSAIDQSGDGSRMPWRSLQDGGLSGTIDAEPRSWLFERGASTGEGFSDDGKSMLFHSGNLSTGTYLGHYDFTTSQLTKVVVTDDDWYYHDPVWLH
jgi:hypothetical protein